MSMRRMTTLVVATIMAAILFVALARPGHAATTHTLDSLAAADGLVAMPAPAMAQAWIKPGADFSAYNGYVMLSTQFAFREPVRRRDDAYEMTDEQKDAVRELVPTAVGQELEELENLTISASSGPNVMLMQIAVLDIVSHVAPERVGRGATFQKSLGEATLAIELRDSVTGELLARAIERREVSPSTMHRSDRVWNRREVRKAAEQFGETLRKQIEQFTQA